MGSDKTEVQLRFSRLIDVLLCRAQSASHYAFGIGAFDYHGPLNRGDGQLIFSYEQVGGVGASLAALFNPSLLWAGQ